MKLILFILFSFLLDILQCRPQNTIPPSTLKNIFNLDDNGYYFSVQTSDGIQHEAHGEVKDDALSVKGSYSFTHSNGAETIVDYTANKDGFKPTYHFKISDPNLVARKLDQPGFSMQQPSISSNESPHEMPNQFSTESSTTKYPQPEYTTDTLPVVVVASSPCLASLCGTQFG